MNQFKWINFSACFIILIDKQRSLSLLIISWVLEQSFYSPVKNWLDMKLNLRLSISAWCCCIYFFILYLNMSLTSIRAFKRTTTINARKSILMQIKAFTNCCRILLFIEICRKLRDFLMFQNLIKISLRLQFLLLH